MIGNPVRQICQNLYVDLVAQLFKVTGTEIRMIVCVQRLKTVIEVRRALRTELDAELTLMTSNLFKGEA